MEIQKSEPAEEMESESHEKDLETICSTAKNTKETTRANWSGKVCEIEFGNNMKCTVLSVILWRTRKKEKERETSILMRHYNAYWSKEIKNYWFGKSILLARTILGAALPINILSAPGSQQSSLGKVWLSAVTRQSNDRTGSDKNSNSHHFNSMVF